ncbi:hypothetical protein ACIQWB_38150 [Streptomyces olivaceus]|uniref:hypothetical protein n=1 Tax=Streptomyces olivaceus TaxID=47716 RepID=UPI00381B6DF2
MSPLRLPPPELLPESRSALRAAGAHLSAPDDGRGTGPRSEDAQPLPDRKEALYDAHFCVVRTPDAPARTLLRALTQTAAEVSVWVPEETRGAVLGALAVCGAVAPAPAPAHSATPLARWRAGHRLFFALTAATVVTLRDATARRAVSHPGPAATRDAAVLLRASAAAMRATASFAPHAYESDVRPSMEPPREQPGFSGLWSADHRALVRQLGNWGRSHAEACPEGCEPARTLGDALAEVHAAHYGVCARFVGRGPSLLGGSPDALHTLGRLMGARGKLLRPDGARPVPPRRREAVDLRRN